MKFLLTTILTILLVLNPILAYPGPLQDEIIRIAPSYIGITEPWGENKGPVVNKLLIDANAKPGDPWCMALVYGINKQACQNIGIKNVVPATAGTAVYWVYAGKRKLTFKITPAKQIMLGAKMNPGATGIFKRGPFRSDGTFPGHADIVYKQIDNMSFMGVDGNVGAKSEWNGDGSAFRIRRLGVPSFLFMGTIDVR